MTARLSTARQESLVAQGLALGVLSHGVEAVPADKLKFELALSYAWRRFRHAGRFPRILAATAPDPVSLVYRSANRRQHQLAAWQTDHEFVPYLTMDGWTVQECGQNLAEDSGVPWEDWRQLARDFLDDLGGNRGPAAGGRA